ncbi:MAG: glycoside hydrolase family 10 protein, partial [Thermoanaerobaculia bacterium]
MKQFLIIIVLLAVAIGVYADDPRPEYRAYWVDTFRTPFATRIDVDRIVDAAIESNANALFVQVRRRGDAWYLDAAEPRAEAMDGTFDPLRALLDAAHARGIQVHAFVIAGAIFHGDPKKGPLPRDPRHVFLQHFWDAKAHRMYTGARQWGTKTSKGRYQFASDWYIDFGHPDAAAYTADVLLHLVRAYDIDGIHLDRIRYPETPKGDAGYNDTSVARFRARYGRLPQAKDALWNDWRREQVTNFVRRLALGAKAIRPSITISAALISWGSGPAASGGFPKTDAYRVAFQDWDAWLREGIIDVASPMLY